MKSNVVIARQSWYQNPFLYSTLLFAGATCALWEAQAGWFAITALVLTGASGSCLLVGDNGWLVGNKL